MTKLIALIILSSLLPGSRLLDHAKKQDAQESKIIKKILLLPEVIKKNKFIDSLSKHKHGISIIILKKPANTTDHYWVQAGYNSDIRFEPYYNFYIYGPQLIIKVFDPMTEKVYSLPEWRKKEKSHK